MDPISHVAFGRTLIALVRHHPDSRGVIGAAVLGSLTPDIDAVFMPFGWDRYLRVHEIGTHSIGGTLACALITAAVIRTRRRQTSWRTLVLAAWIGTAGHAALDLASSARVRFLWPAFDRHWTLPLVAMADPLLLGLLCFGVLLLAIVGRRHHRPAAAAALACLAAFLALKGVLAIRAVGAYDDTTAGQRIDARVIEARWGSLREWSVFDRTREDVRGWRSVAGEPAATLLLRWPRADTSGIVDASRSFSTVRNFLRSHELALATVSPSPDGLTAVLWSDVRYCWDPSTRPSDPDVTVGTLRDGRRIACGLWFGGTFDRRHAPVREVVRIGAFTQTRAVRE
jgi:membrane-bound metal-dependent hydrolase YbcI (DUF457 family)